MLHELYKIRDRLGRIKSSKDLTDGYYISIDESYSSSDGWGGHSREHKTVLYRCNSLEEWNEIIAIIEAIKSPVLYKAIKIGVAKVKTTLAIEVE